MDRSEIELLSGEDKFKVYLHYVIVQLSLKHNFNTRDVIDDPENNGWGPADKIHGNLELRYLWKDLRYHSFEEFIVVKDGMCVPDYLPLWEWYWRFEHEIVFK